MEKNTQKNKIWEEFLGTPSYPNGSMWGMIRDFAEKYPKNTALKFMGKSISYGKLADSVRKLKSGFKTLGIKKGDAVMLCLPNIPEAVYSLYALNSLGAVVCFVHPLSSESEISDYYDKSESKVVVTLTTLYDKFMGAFEGKEKPLMILTSGELELSFAAEMYTNFSERKMRRSIPFGGQVRRFSDLLKTGGVFEENETTSAEDTAVILFSGGTTGEPKAVLLSNLNLNATAVNMGIASGYDLREKSVLAAMPVFHGYGLGVGIHAPLSHGGVSVLLPKFKNTLVAKNIIKEKPQFILGVPTFFEALRRNPHLKKADLSFLLGAFSGGDTLSPEHKRNFESFLESHNSDIYIREGYGCTECVSATTLSPISGEKAGSVGRPLPSMEVKICEAGTTDEVPFGTIGEILISGVTVMKGYKESYGEDVLRVHSDQKVWLHTGDLGCLDEEGYLYFKGRLKRLVVTSGYNVYPVSLEAILCEHKNVLQCCVVGVNDPYRMERLKAFVVTGSAPEDEEKFKAELIEFQKGRVAKYSIVKDIELRDSLPLTKLLKVDYRKLYEEANRAIPVS